MEEDISSTSQEKLSHMSKMNILLEYVSQYLDVLKEDMLPAVEDSSLLKVTRQVNCIFQSILAIKSELNELMRKETASDVEQELNENPDDDENVKGVDFENEANDDENEESMSIKTECFQCTICNQSFLEQSEFMSHWQEHVQSNDLQCGVCNESMESLPLDEISNHCNLHIQGGLQQIEHYETNDRENESEKLEVAYAKTEEYTLYEQEEHSTKRDDGACECHICFKPFTNEVSLQSHMERLHYYGLKYKCEICLRYFPDRELLDLHKGTHPNILRPHVCELCTKPFPNKSLLEAHKRMHSGERPFKCEQCDKTFIRKHHLNGHVRTVHKMEFLCVNCKVNFTSGAKLRNHMCEQQIAAATTRAVSEEKVASPETIEHELERDVASENIVVDRQDDEGQGNVEVPVVYSVIHENVEVSEVQEPAQESQEQNTGMEVEESGTQAEEEGEVERREDTTENEEFQSEENHVTENQPNIKRRFKCPECPKHFRSETYLKQHMKWHSEDNLFKCDGCEKSFVTNSEYRAHKRKGCHTTRHCTHCPKTFVNPSSLRKHILMMHSSQDSSQKGNVCNICQKSFNSALTLKMHLKAHQRDDRYKCLDCDKVLNTKGEYDRHMIIHSSDRPYSCELCGKTFKRKNHVSDHKKHKHGPLKFACPSCGRLFATLSLLKLHQRVHAEKLHQCSECAACFCTDKELRMHIKRNHTAEKPHLCPHCPMKFPSPSTLKLHVRVHTGEKPYVCDNCGASFYRSGSLKRHMKLHTGVGLFTCQECGKHFPVSTELRNHMRTHQGLRPYQCEECGKSFFQISHLKDHIASHSDVKQFSCQVCQKSFRRRNNLRDHMKTHTGEKLKECTDCGKAYTTLKHLKKHQERHQMEDSMKKVNTTTNLKLATRVEEGSQIYRAVVPEGEALPASAEHITYVKPAISVPTGSRPEAQFQVKVEEVSTYEEGLEPGATVIYAAADEAGEGQSVIVEGVGPDEYQVIESGIEYVTEQQHVQLQEQEEISTTMEEDGHSVEVTNEPQEQIVYLKFEY